MTAPDFLPVLAAGSHLNPAAGACVMEYVSLLAGERFSDTPSCTHPVLAAMAQVVNDRLSNADRPLLVPLIGRLFGTAETGTPLERQQLSVRLAVWCAREVLPLVRPEDQQVCATAIDAAETWANNPSAANATTAATSATSAYANANAAYAANATTAAAAYAAAAAAAAAYAHTAFGIGFLTGLLGEYDRLTGRTDTLPHAAERAQALYATAVAT